MIRTQRPAQRRGSNKTAQGSSSSSMTRWNALFLGFSGLAVAACFLTVYTGSLVLPDTHEVHNMDHSMKHPSFDAPGNIYLKHNQQHQKEFEAAYKMKLQEDFDKSYRHPAVANAVEEEHKLETAKAAAAAAAAKAAASQPHKPVAGKKYHMVFSTSCSPFQNWQSLAFFYFARKVRQPGTVTRLVAGCTNEQTQELRKVHAERVVPLQIPGLQTFELHVTPTFDDSNGGDQKYFNKPNGLLHWMENSLGFDGKHEHEDDDAFVIIVDPDMMLLRPITEDFSSINYVGGWVDTDNVKKHRAEGTSKVDYSSDVVRHGHPHAQKYGYGNGWFTAKKVKDHFVEIVGPDSPVHNMTTADAKDYYPAGPPYVATARDMYQIAVHWVKFLPKYHNFFTGMMCEMHSYSLAAAHLQLPHKLAHGFMISDVESDETFEFIDTKMNKTNACQHPPQLRPKVNGKPMLPTDSTTMTDPAYEVDLNLPIRQLPFVLHFCQRYAIGRYFFSKYKLLEEIFDNCTAPLMIEPPSNVVEIYDWNIFPNGVEKSDFSPHADDSQAKKDQRVNFRLRHGWLLCAVIFGVNEAVEHLKTSHCGTNEKFFRKTWHFHEPDAFAKSLEDPSNPFVGQNVGAMDYPDDSGSKDKKEKPVDSGKQEEPVEKGAVEEIDAALSEKIEKEIPDILKPTKDTSKVNYMERGNAEDDTD